MANPTDLQETGPELTTDDMAAEMRARGISEADITKSVGAMQNVPGAQVGLSPAPGPEDLQEGAPQPSGVNSPGLSHLQAILKWNQENRRRIRQGGGLLGDKAAPSPATALSLVMPGSGLAGAAGRSAASGLAQAGEAALEGTRDPMAAGVQGAAMQALAEGVVPAARMVGRGASALARPWTNQAALLKMLAQAPGASTPTPPVPSNWGKFEGTGIPAGHGGPVLYGPTGQPLKPAVPAQVIPHPTIPGWTMKDIIGELAKGATKPNYWQLQDPLRALMRILGAGTQEAETRAMEPTR